MKKAKNYGLRLDTKTVMVFENKKTVKGAGYADTTIPTNTSTITGLFTSSKSAMQKQYENQ